MLAPLVFSIVQCVYVTVGVGAVRGLEKSVNGMINMSKMRGILVN